MEEKELKYEPFELEELPKMAVVNSNAYAEESDQDRLINKAVSHHLNTIIDNQDKNATNNVFKAAEQEAPIVSKILVEDLIATQNNTEQTITQQPDLSQATEPNQSATDEVKKNNELEPQATIKNIITKPTTATAQPKMQTQEKIVSTVDTDKFSQVLLEKLSSITSNINLDLQVTKFSATAISDIAKKLYLALPVDFEKIISNELIEKVKKFYKKGKITLTINPEKYDFCKEILQSDNIPDKLKDSFEIVKDSNLGTGDCKITWHNTCLEYNQEQLSAEIDKIIELLKNAIPKASKDPEISLKLKN